MQPPGQAAECKTKRACLGCFPSVKGKEKSGLLFFICHAFLLYLLPFLFICFVFIFAVSSNVCVTLMRSSDTATPGLWCCACVGCPIIGWAALSPQTQTCSSPLTILHSLMSSLSLSNYCCCYNLPEDGRVVALLLKLL